MGGGLWGSLLAYRLSEIKPDLDFILYENEENLGEGISQIVYQNDFSPQGNRWLTPFFEKSWKSHQVKFHGMDKVLESGVGLISAKKIRSVLMKKIGDRIRPLDEIENVLNECSFIIDTRNNFYYPSQGFQKITELEIKTKHMPLNLPILCDGTVSQWDGFRYAQYFPLSDDRLIVRDIRHSAEATIFGEDFEEQIMETLALAGIHADDVVQKSSWLFRIPSSSLIPWNEGRILRLAGISHDFTGNSVADAVRLIDRMVSTSFRRGELNEVVLNYRSEREARRKFFRIMSRYSLNPSNSRAGVIVMERLYKMPRSVREKFFLGELDFMDFMRTLVRIKVLRPMPSFIRSS